MHAIDTNVLVRLIARDDPRQVERAERFVDEGAWVSLLVLAETVWELQSVFGLEARQIALAITMLLEHDRLGLQDPEVVREALETFSKTRTAGFTDCLIVAIACQAGHDVVGTFDQKMSGIPGVKQL